MSVYIDEEGDVKLPFDVRAVAELVTETALKNAACPYEAAVNILLTTDDEIRKLNKEFRGIDEATDVLSFPMIEFNAAGDFSAVDSDGAGFFDPDFGELNLGDIVISKDKALFQAEAYGHSPKREYAFLIAHSMLHLFGYDHIKEEERAAMEEKQKKILEEAGILRT